MPRKVSRCGVNMSEGVRVQPGSGHVYAVKHAEMSSKGRDTDTIWTEMVVAWSDR